MIEREENFDINERLKKYGKVSSTWECSLKCGNSLTSFLYNFECHIPEKCDKCNEGIMIEDETKRVTPFKPNIGGGKQEEDRRFNEMPVWKQASILADEKSDNFY